VMKMRSIWWMILQISKVVQPSAEVSAKVFCYGNKGYIGLEFCRVSKLMNFYTSWLALSCVQHLCFRIVSGRCFIWILSVVSLCSSWIPSVPSGTVKHAVIVLEIRPLWLLCMSHLMHYLLSSILISAVCLVL
jgi:hypothetical protein